ncbi:MAG: (Fe-S)-binding protein [Anaerolineae bacterium]|nr:(Fe-S)-binding protein [Anaerolineae bacterium]MDW8100170.1 (Fe-S)-binding protein [Anaerolineae bacterium]
MRIPSLRRLAEVHTVTLFVTCMVDMLYPEVGEATVSLLESLGLEVTFPEDQTCCGQPAYNAGYREDARTLALRFLDVFEGARVIVTPSGSCAAMIRHGYLDLLADDPVAFPRARALSERTWEFSQFLVEGLGAVDVGARFEGLVAYHDSCHLARALGVTRPPRELLRHVQGAQLVELPGHDECCGFGGLFAVKMPEISSAMLARKLNHIARCGANVIVTSDVSCMTQINGGLRRARMPQRVWHLAHFLAAHRALK